MAPSRSVTKYRRTSAGALIGWRLGMRTVHECGNEPSENATLAKRAVDTAIQLNGGRGYSKDTPLEWIYRYARQARLVDGASEVHRMVLARFYMDERNDFWSWR